ISSPGDQLVGCPRCFNAFSMRHERGRSAQVDAFTLSMEAVMDQVRVGVIGAGFMGALHARAVAESGFGTLVAVADPDVGRAQDLAVAHGAIAYTDYGEMF